MKDAGLPFVKGHGTGNDFVVLPDIDDRLELTEELVSAICHRRFGLGADGVLRVARRDGGWFMDYRNADGSIVETCGNGIRVFARYLTESGMSPTGTVAVVTRAGVRAVEVPADGSDISVSMGPAISLPHSIVHIGGRSLPAVGVSMGNPHLVALDVEDLDGLDLSEIPLLDNKSAYPQGVNVEFVSLVDAGHIRMRVHERGVGETLSCGTGACAAAVASMDDDGIADASYRVDVRGGRLIVTRGADGDISLTGPAVLVARGEIDVPRLMSAWHHRATPAQAG